MPISWSDVYTTYNTTVASGYEPSDGGPMGTAETDESAVQEIDLLLHDLPLLDRLFCKKSIF